MENLRKHIKLVTTKKRSNYFISKPAFHTTKFFTENLLAIKMKKTEILKTKPVSFWLSILKLSKILIHEFCCDCIKQKYDEKTKLYYMDTNSFIVYIKRDDIYKDISEDVDTSSYELERNLFG